jgi:flagellum-specific ATP synthase
MSQAELAPRWQAFLSDAQKRVRSGNKLAVRGTLTRLTGLVLEASGLRVPVGSQCWSP